jgi:hypothetical protein
MTRSPILPKGARSKVRPSSRSNIKARHGASDPKYWRIVDGKLYLNYDASVQQRWERDIPGFIRKADGNWPRVLEQN